MSKLESLADSLCEALGTEFYSLETYGGKIIGAAINTEEFEVTIRPAGGSDE